MSFVLGFVAGGFVGIFIMSALIMSGEKMNTREKLSAAAFFCVAGLSAGLAFVGFVYLIKFVEGI